MERGESYRIDMQNLDVLSTTGDLNMYGRTGGDVETVGCAWQS